MSFKGPVRLVVGFLVQDDESPTDHKRIQQESTSFVWWAVSELSAFSVNCQIKFFLPEVPNKREGKGDYRGIGWEIPKWNLIHTNLGRNLSNSNSYSNTL
jgi:hypothetical protein